MTTPAAAYGRRWTDAVQHPGNGVSIGQARVDQHERTFMQPLSAVHPEVVSSGSEGEAMAPQSPNKEK